MAGGAALLQALDAKRTVVDLDLERERGRVAAFVPLRRLRLLAGLVQFSRQRSAAADVEAVAGDGRARRQIDGERAIEQALRRPGTIAPLAEGGPNSQKSQLCATLLSVTWRFPPTWTSAAVRLLNSGQNR